MTRRIGARLLATVSLAACSLGFNAPASAQTPAKPNIVIIWGDDIGQSNVSAYSRGLMGYQTPTLRLWAAPFVNLRVPKIFNLRTDPYERADITSNTYYDWLMDHVFLLIPAQDYVGQFLSSFKEFPQRQKASSFNLDEVMSKLGDTMLLENQGLGAPKQ